MRKQRLPALITLGGALLVVIGTVFHPPLTDPWDVNFAYHKMIHHQHWSLDHWIFLTGLTLWLIGLAYLADVYKSSNASRCLMGSYVMWVMILAVEIAVLPPLTHSHHQAAREIWNALFTWGLFAGYLSMGIIYIGVLLLGFSGRGLLYTLAKITGFLGIIGVIVSLLLPNTALIIQLITAPFPFLWTVWFSVRFVRARTSF